MKLIAVIMSVYKNDHISYVETALSSLYEQKPNVDIFVYEDGKISTDLSLFLEKELEKKKIHYLLTSAENHGLGYSLNALLAIVPDKYEYIVRMDADDICMAERIELQYAFMEKNKHIDVVGSYIEEFIEPNHYSKIVTYPLDHDEMFDFFKKRVPLAHVTAFFRKSFFEKTGLYPTTSPTNEDTLLWMNGFKNGCQFANIPEVLVRVRISKNFFGRRGGLKKAWSDFRDRVLVIKTLGYNISSYFYAAALFLVNIAPAGIKAFLYKRLR